MSTYLLDPNATLDFAFDWASWLEDGETLTAETVTATAGATVINDTIDGTRVVYWLTGGQVGSDVEVTCRVTSSAGRVDERSVRVLVRDR